MGGCQHSRIYIYIYIDNNAKVYISYSYKEFMWVCIIIGDAIRCLTADLCREPCLI